MENEYTPDGEARVRINESRGSDIPIDIFIKERQYIKQELTSRTYDFDKDKKSRLNSQMGGVI